MIEIKSEFIVNRVDTKIELSGDQFETFMEIVATFAALEKKLKEMQPGGDTEKASEEVTTCS